MTFDYWQCCLEKTKQEVVDYGRDLSEKEKRIRQARDSYQKSMLRSEMRQRKNEMRRNLVESDPSDLDFHFLSGRLADVATLWWLAGLPRKEDARQELYMPLARDVDGESFRRGLSQSYPSDCDFSNLPDPTWIGLEVAFTLLTPWYSKDDRVFHVLDNPVRKDRLFGVPFMAASSWKGMLRWACRMQAGLLDHLEKHHGAMDAWQEPDWILHLFGNEKQDEETAGRQEEFHRGALFFFPTWFHKVDFEVINPHSRERRAGTQPIYYEVVPAGTPGIFRLLYAPLPGQEAKDQPTPGDALANLIDAIADLLVNYGISAKRTAGWGTAGITGWRAYNQKDRIPQTGSDDDWEKDKKAIAEWVKQYAAREGGN